MATITIEDTVTGSIHTVPLWEVSSLIRGWYLGDVPEIIDTGINELQRRIESGEDTRLIETYLGITLTR